MRYGSDKKYTWVGGREEKMSLRQLSNLICMQDTGFFSKKPEAKSAHEQMMSNPDMMTDMLKKNMGGIIPQAIPFCIDIFNC